MDAQAPDVEALAETVVFLGYFKELPDPRQRGKVTYPLSEVPARGAGGSRNHHRHSPLRG